MIVTLHPESLTAISREVARQIDSRLEVVGVASTDGGSERVELLVTLAGCHTDPCTVMINITRSDASSFEHELRQALADALVEHRGRTAN